MSKKKKYVSIKNTSGEMSGATEINQVADAAASPTSEGSKPRVIDFINRRKIWYIISLLVVIPGLISCFMHGKEFLNWGIDFTGGNMIQVKFADPAIDSSRVKTELDKIGLQKTPVIQTTTEGEFLIRTEELTEEKSDQLLTTMKNDLGTMDIQRNEKVGGVIGGELSKNALFALLLAALFILIYVSFRFEFLYGIASIIALLHDALVVIGVFSIFRLEVDVSFVAALLTILGYSINDTIVIFDRIRENRKKYPKMELIEMVNLSISQTLARSINTVLTVIFCLVALLIFGGQTTKVFVLAMLVGTISGCYSSIFNASPLWVDFMRIKGKKGGRKAFAGAR